jgi:type IV secretion system protein VirD4
MKSGAIACRVMLMGGCGCFIASVLIGGLRFPGFAMLVIGLVAWLNGRRWRGSGTAHGTARIADLQDLQENGLLDAEGGLILGRSEYTSPPPRWYALRYLFKAPFSKSATAVKVFLSSFSKQKTGRSGLIRLRHFVHLVTFAATGRGKGVGVLVPNLLRYSSSCVVTDPKSELFRLTSGYRQKYLKNRIIRLDPFELAGPGSDTLNLFILIDPNSPHSLDQCRDLANMLVVRTNHEHEPHFNDSAELVLTAIIAFVAACETSHEHRNLRTVRDIVCSRARFAKAIEAMQKSTACGGILQRYGHLLTWFVDRELGSVLTTVQRHTIFLDSPAVAASTSESTFDPRRLREERMTVYLCLPHDRLETLAPLQRMWIGTILRAVSASGADERNPVLFLLDEAGHLGHIQALEDAVTMLRGMGVRLWFFFQSVGQLSKCFGDRASIFLDNIDTQQFFGINAIESADLISKRLGDATITTESFQQGTSYSQSSGGGSQQQSGQHSSSDSHIV